MQSYPINIYSVGCCKDCFSCLQPWSCHLSLCTPPGKLQVFFSKCFTTVHFPIFYLSFNIERTSPFCNQP